VTKRASRKMAKMDKLFMTGQIEWPIYDVCREEICISDVYSIVQ
jgi:hypothetical protein